MAPAQLQVSAQREKRQFEFLADSFALARRGLLADASFLRRLLVFSDKKRDYITPETIELL